MQQVDLESIPNWNDTSGVLLPQSIDSVCPGCHRFVNLTLLFFDRVQRADAYVSKARCPACSFEATVVTLAPKPTAAERDEATVVSIYPPIQGRAPMVGSEKLPERIARAYEALLSVHRAGEWTAVATMAGRMLEALTHEALHGREPGVPVHELIERVPDHMPLAKPIHDLAAVLHASEPLGKLLNMEVPADAATAEQLVDAAEMFAQYLILLPERIEAIAVGREGRTDERRDAA